MSPIEQLLMPNTYVKLMARVAPDRATLLAGSGLSEAQVIEGDSPITVRQQLICARNSAAMARREDWHLAWAARIGERFHGPLTTAWLNAPTLGDGLDVFVAYMPQRIPYLAWRTDDLPLGRRYEVWPLMDLGTLAAALVELPLLTLLGYLRAMRAGRIEGAVVELAHTPLTDPAVYRRRFHCQFTFGAPRCALTVPVAWRTMPNPGYDEEIWHAARRRCEAPTPGAPALNVVSQVARALAESLADGRGSRTPPTLAEMATHLHFSIRTLNRRLRDAGATYRELVDEARKARARVLLTDRGRRAGDIASLLGFDDPASFGRSFKRWYGVTPGRFRKTLTSPR